MFTFHSTLQQYVHYNSSGIFIMFQNEQVNCFHSYVSQSRINRFKKGMMFK